MRAAGRAPDPARETELKLQVSPEDLERVVRHARALAGAALERRLVSSYFDTDAGALAADGVGLRMRWDGTRWVQTVKRGGSLIGGMSTPLESEVEVSGPTPEPHSIPDPKLRARVQERIGDAALERAVTTEFIRRWWLLDPNGCTAELALDRGLVAAGGRSRDICEAELEWKSGPVEGFLALAIDLFNAVPFEFSTASKGEIGLSLLRGEPEAPGAIRKHRAKIKGKKTGQAFAEMFAASVGQVFANWSATLETDDPEAAHQLRVGLRRTRTALKMLRGFVDNDDLRRLNAGLAALGRDVGALRNRDVLRAAVVGPALADLDRGTADRITAKLESDRADVRDALRARLRSAALNPLRLKLALLPQGAHWGSAKGLKAPIGKRATAILRPLWKRVRKRGRKMAQLSDSQRHALRKDLKTLRIAVDFLAPVLPKARTAAFQARIGQLQDDFGYLNDLTLLPLLQVTLAGDAGAAAVLTSVRDRHASRAESTRQSIAVHWVGLAAAPKPWNH